MSSKKWGRKMVLYGTTVIFAVFVCGVQGQSEGEIPPDAASMAFVFDATGSMFDDLMQVKTGASKIFATIMERRHESPIYNYVLVPFHDPEIGPLTVTTKEEEFLANLDDIYVQGGGDCPEMSIGAIKLALENSLPGSFVYVFTDASAKDYLLLNPVLDLIQKKQSQVVFVLTGDCGDSSHPGYQVYEIIAATSSGQVFHLNKVDVEKVLAFVRVSLQARRVNLLSVKRQNGSADRLDLVVDKTLSEFTVSVSGDKPKVDVYNPQGNIVDKEDGLNELLDLENVKVVNVKDPDPGKWQVELESDSVHSVRATGLSRLDFVYGFDIHDTTDMNSTRHRPLKGIPNKIMIVATEPEEIERLDRVEVINLNGQTVMNISLFQIDGQQEVYKGDFPNLSNDYFYLQVHGTDRNGNLLRRITATAISPESPAVPVVTTEPLVTGYVNEASELPCYIDSDVPYAVSWWKNNVPISDRQQFNEPTHIPMKISKLLMDSEGTYECVATNVAGLSSSKTYLDVKGIPPTISATRKQLVATNGDSVVLHCEAHGVPVPVIHWKKGNHLVQSTALVQVSDTGRLLLRDVQESVAGMYTCVAENEAGRAEDDVLLAVGMYPRIIQGPLDVEVEIYNNLTLPCVAVGLPVPVITWQKRNSDSLDDSRARKLDGGSLWIGEIQPEDEGNYICTVKNEFGTEHAEANVRVIGVAEPILAASDLFLSPRKGETINLICNVLQGNPPPFLRWYKDGKLVEGNSDIEVIHGGSQLIIHNAGNEHDGEYTCVARNSAGRANVTSVVDVQVPPSIRHNGDKEYTVAEGNRILLPCQVVGDSPLSITWQKNGIPILPFHKGYKIRRDYSLEVRAAQEEDAGTYVCTAVNRAGVTNMALALQVEAPPKISPSTDMIRVPEGHEVTIPCDVKGLPTPTVTWEKDGTILDADDSAFTFLNGGGICFQASTLESGTYICHATNKLGATWKSTEVVLLVPPVIISRGDDLMVATDGDRLSIPCLAHGVPPPQLEWFKDGLKIDGSNHSSFELTIDSVTIKSTGNYTCMARNEIGIDERMVQLYIQVSPKVVDLPSAINVTEGKSVNIQCEATGVPEPNIKWLRKVKGQDIAYAVGVGNFITLSSVRVDQAGEEYICVAENHIGQDRKVLSINVLVPPKVQNNTSGMTVEVTEGVPVQLVCPVEGVPVPDILWYKNNEPLSLNTNERSDLIHISLIDDPHSLKIYEARSSDTGNYTCIASNAAGNSSVDFKLDVLTLPHFEEFHYEPNLLLHEGEKIVLECKAVGNPKPEISWKKKDGQILIPVKFTEETSDVKNYTMEIEDAKMEFSGIYRCEVFSKVGMIYRDFHVAVQGAPKLDGPSSETVDVLEGNPLVLICPLSAVPKAYIEWRKDGSTSFLGEQNVVIRKNGIELEIPIAKVEDQASYMCLGKNAYGSAEKHFEVFVLVPPVITSSDQVDKVKVKVGTNVTLSCNASGNPNPDLIWYKNGEKLHLTSANFGISGNQKGDMLIIDAQLSNVGQYSCAAFNKVGNTQKDFMVEVLVPPTMTDVITSAPIHREVLERLPVTLTCSVQGVPPPRITWKKDDIPLDLDMHSHVQVINEGHSLHIKEAVSQDAGMYMCVAANEVGHVTRHFDLHVLVSPTIQEPDLLQRVRVKAGELLKLQCLSSGYPVPKVIWLKSDNQIFSEGQMGFVINETDMSLTILSAALGDVGPYTCIVSNTAGDAEKEFDVDVLVPPKLELLQEFLENDLNVRLNRPINFFCPVTGRPEPELVWKKDGMELPNSGDYNIRVSHDKKQLRILQVKDGDAGTYECEAANEAGTMTLPFHLNVLIPPHLPKDIIKTKFRVSENESLVLNCPAVGNPKVSALWLKDGQLLIVSQGSRSKWETSLSDRIFISDDTKQLVVVNTTAKDAGKYTCIATNEAGSVELDYKVEILTKPTMDMSEVEQVIEVALNRPVVLHCPVKGIPFPSVRWLKDGVPINSLGTVNHAVSADGRKLKLRQVQRSDAGKYTCSGINEMGQVHQEFDLRVQVPPVINSPTNDVNEIFGFSLPNPTPGLENENITLDCNVTGYPEPTILWFKDGSLLQLEESEEKFVILNKNRSLELTNLQKEDGGKYTCMALNSVGSAELSFDVEVWSKPELMHHVSTQSVVIINYPTVLECPVDGYPPPEVTWMKDVKVLDESDDHLLRLTNGGQQLQILRSLPSHRGNYTCMAHNEAGAVKVPYVLDIWEPPTIRTSDAKPAVREGDNATLICIPSGHPTPQVIWFHEGDILFPEHLETLNMSISDSGHKLHIQEATQDHQGKYTCLATSLAGSAELTFFVSIHMPPIITGKNHDHHTTVMINRPVILECPVDARPEATVTWLKNGRPLRATLAHNFQLIMGDQRLHIPNSQEGDAGIYECVATNDLGEARREFEVEILVPPRLDGEGSTFPSDRESNILEYQTADITCYVKGNPQPSVFWMKDGKDLSPQERRFQMLHNNQVLRIAEAKAGDGGRYTCIATSPSGKLEKDFSLVVQAPPTIVVASPDKLVAFPNQPAQIECQAVGNPDPQIKWLKNGNSLDDGSDSLIQVQSRGQELLLRQVRISDAGRYTCIAYNSVGQDEEHFVLEVHTPPIIERPKTHQQQVLLDSSLTLSCAASGNPPPTFTWLKDEEPIRDLEHPRFLVLAGGSKLRIDSAQLSDSAVFKCVAENSVGRDEITQLVKVLGPPRVRKREAPNQIEVVEGKSFIIECPVEGTPEPMIMWQKEGKNVSMFSHPTLEVLDGGKMLKILRAVPTDAGLYKCLASNVAGEMDFITPVEVLVPPKLEGDGEHIHMKVLERHVVTFHCTVLGNPQPKVTWQRNSDVLVEVFNIKILPNQEQMRIHNVSVDDAANFSCVASNSIGVAKKSFTLDVLAPPTIGVAPNTLDQAVVEGEKVEFECPVRGNPKPRVLWYRDSELLQSQSGVLISADGTMLELSSVKVSDSGTYTCMAVNEAGEDEAFFELEVWVLPVVENNKIDMQLQVILHHPVMFECKTSGVPLPVITWLKDNMVWEPEKQNNVQVLERGQMIQILDALEEDGASYTCLAQNLAGESEKQYQLDVLVPPDIMTVASRRNLQVVQNDDVTLECPAKGEPLPEMVWMKDGVLIENDDSRVQVEADGTELTISAVQVTDAGEYKCVAANEAGMKEAIMVLNVVVPPSISDQETSEFLEVTANHPVTLLCPANGVPTPSIGWRKDGIDLLQKEGPILFIKRIQVDLSGLYECRASNPAGLARKFFKVNVNVPPVIQESSTEALITVVVGDSFALTCFTNGTPTPNLHWIKDGESLHFYPSLNFSVLNDNQEIHVEDAELKHHGKYSCHAKNIAGKDSKKFEVVVLEPPRLKTLTPELHVIRGEPVTLSCSVQGYPKPQISWSKDSKDLSFLSSHYQIRNGNLEMKIVQEEDAGKYTCTATNEAGMVSQIIRLYVKVPPSVQPSVQDLTVIEGHSVSLGCKASGKPEPQTLWMFEAEEVDKKLGYKMMSDGTLNINSAHTEHTGTYNCLVQNDVGSAQAARKLQVLVAPIIQESQVEYSVTVGQEATLHCTSKGVPSPITRWERNTKPLDLQDPRVMVLPNGNLKISLAQSGDMGTYRCVVENQAGVDHRVMALSVKVSPSVMPGHTQYSIPKGGQLLVPCRASGFPMPNISWSHNGSPITLEGSSHQEVHPMGDLILRRAEPNMTGTYICMAINDVGRAYREVNIDVIYPPIFVVFPEDQVVTLMGSFNMTCEARGHPTPDLIWLHNKEPLGGQPAFINGRSTLTIRDVKQDDAGIYTCVVKNSAGEKRTSAIVVVKVPPKLMYTPSSQYANMASRAVMDCMAEGDPLPQVLWVKDGHKLDMSSRMQQMPNGSLVIYNLNDYDEGQYKCVASNEVGAVEGAAELIVHRPPIIVSGPRNAVVDLGETFTLHCKVEGSPTPTVVWSKGQSEDQDQDGTSNEDFINENPRYILLSNNSLQIIAVQIEDEDVYKCTANNILGQDSIQGKLTVRVHGSWASWGPWQSCSVTCGSGTQTRWRLCTNPIPRNGGKDCPDVARDVKECELEPCAMHGGWGSWGDWSRCSSSCGEGSRIRVRVCDSPSPRYGGKMCEGSAVQSQICLQQSCPQDGNWSQWTEWGACSSTCGEGLQRRTRMCDSPSPQHGGRGCKGSDHQTRGCHNRECQIDGSWGPWNEWSSCSQSCGLGGSRVRTRHCSNPPPSRGGLDCPGSNMQRSSCAGPPCFSVRVEWSGWSKWTQCSRTCGGGVRRRFRTCGEVGHAERRRECPGSDVEAEPCQMQQCPENGEWSAWSEWSHCSVTCGSGSRERRRSCSNPPPRARGLKCMGDTQQVEKCIQHPCEGFPQQAKANVIGRINHENVGHSILTANVSSSGMQRIVQATLTDVPQHQSGQWSYLSSLLSPVSWSAAYEAGDSQNGFSLTGGHFRKETRIQFDSGEEVVLTHVVRGTDENGILVLDVMVSGEVPSPPTHAYVIVDPYTEDYVQVGDGVLHAAAERTFRTSDGHMYPYKWNDTLVYDESRGPMPHVVQRQYTQGIATNYNPNTKEMNFMLSTTMAKASDECPDGFLKSTSGTYCEDENECDSRPSCSHICINTVGSFMCSCPVGLKLDETGFYCQDVDECQGNPHICPSDQDCQNTHGSFNCFSRCQNGFTRSVSRNSCEDIDECLQMPRACEHQCVNTYGSFQCSCYKGYRLKDRTRCEDINECVEEHSCSHTCHNVAGSFSCACPPGFSLWRDHHCQDVDECSIGTHQCLPGETCENVQGSYQCTVDCSPGFHRASNGTCIVMDECELGTHRCHSTQKCQKLHVGYHCTCNEGYSSSGTGEPCTDIDECKQNPPPCSYECHNLEGNYECTCAPGQNRLADRKTCTDPESIQYAHGRKPEVSTFQFPYSEDTEAFQFHFLAEYLTPVEHRCPDGYIVVEEKCEDYNECEYEIPCDYQCENTEGSFRCLCPVGFMLHGDGSSCDDVDECEQKLTLCENNMCFNTYGGSRCVDVSCPGEYEADDSGNCIHQCEGNWSSCFASTQEASVLQKQLVALPGSLQPYQTITGLQTKHEVQDQGESHTTFKITENESGVPFRIRLEEGKGVLYALKKIEEATDYRLTVEALVHNEDGKVLYKQIFHVLLAIGGSPI